MEGSSSDMRSSVLAANAAGVEGRFCVLSSDVKESKMDRQEIMATELEVALTEALLKYWRWQGGAAIVRHVDGTFAAWAGAEVRQTAPSATVVLMVTDYHELLGDDAPDPINMSDEDVLATVWWLIEETDLGPELLAGVMEGEEPNEDPVLLKLEGE